MHGAANSTPLIESKSAEERRANQDMPCLWARHPRACADACAHPCQVVGGVSAANQNKLHKSSMAIGKGPPARALRPPPPSSRSPDVAFGVIMINTADPGGRGRTSPAHISNILSSSKRETPPKGVNAFSLSVGRSHLPTVPPFFLANWLLSSCFTY